MNKRMRDFLSLACLAACLAAPVLHFVGKLSSEANKRVFLAASIGWFVLSGLRSRRS